jgi:hypothetical protein
VRRTVLLALALALTFLVTGCGTPAEVRPRPEPRAAEPQRVELGWRETYPATGRERLVFLVDSLEVTSRGWTARIGVRNDTGVAYAARPGTADSRYGLMLFATGDLGELEDAASSGGLPPVREAAAIEPEPPATLAAGATWRATLSARGSLPAGSHVRVVFGPLRAEGEPPEGLEAEIVWITDRSHRLRP